MCISEVAHAAFLILETVFLKRNSAYSETAKGPCMCLSLKK